MPNVKIQVKREPKDGALRPFVVLEDIDNGHQRIVEFVNGDEAYVYVRAGKVQALGVHCEGPRGASNTVTVLQADAEIIDPLTATVRSDHGVGYASDRFTAAAR